MVIMHPTTLAAAGLAGAGIGLGVVLAGRGASGLAAPRLRALAGAPGGAGRRWPGRRRLLAAVVVAAAAVVVTGWPVAALLAAGAVLALPGMLATDPAGKIMVARVEAVAGWAEMLRDTLAAAAGLEQAITVTAPIAPEPIRPQIEQLAAAIAAGQPLAPALRATATRLGDPTADLVISALVMATERHARDLGRLLGTLAAAAREQAAMRMRVHAGRAQTRTAVRVIVSVTGLMAAGLVVLNKSYLAPYNTPGGQVALLAVGGLFGLAYLWMGQVTRVRPPARILTRIPDQPTTADPTATAPADGAVVR